MAFARDVADLRSGFAVFPSNEAALMEARAGPFAGCISATVNLNADLCARAYREGDADALACAVAIRRLFDGKPLVAGVKAVLAQVRADPAWARVLPPLTAIAAEDARSLFEGCRRVRASQPVKAA
jgi:4-hydroxy-tetrahydrodipicolinate synthase